MRTNVHRSVCMCVYRSLCQSVRVCACLRAGLLVHPVTPKLPSNVNVSFIKSHWATHTLHGSALTIVVRLEPVMGRERCMRADRLQHLALTSCVCDVAACDSACEKRARIIIRAVMSDPAASAAGPPPPACAPPKHLLPGMPLNSPSSDTAPFPMLQTRIDRAGSKCGSW